MPAVSKDQQAAAGIARSVEKGDKPQSELRGASKRMFQSMRGKGELHKFAATKRKGLPKHVGEARQMFERDDAPKLGLGKTGLKFARMTSKEAFKPAGNSDTKWKTSLKLRAGLAGEKPNAPMHSNDKVGKVPHAMKESTRRKALAKRFKSGDLHSEAVTPQKVVAVLLDD